MLAKEIALVTGGSRGIGRAICLALAKENAQVVVNYSHSKEEAEQVVALIEEGGGKALAIKADVSNLAEVEAMFSHVESIWGKVSILVNNAGITKDGLLLRMSQDDWEQVLSVNLTGAFHCSKIAVKGMLKQKKGSIIQVSSIVGLTGNPGQANYAAAKAGLIGFSKSLAKEVGNRGIRVNVVAPGFIETEMTAKLPEETIGALKKQVSLGRLGTPEDVAQVVLFLASASGGYLTGEVIKVDGGLQI